MPVGPNITARVLPEPAVLALPVAPRLAPGHGPVLAEDAVRMVSFWSVCWFPVRTHSVCTREQWADANGVSTEPPDESTILSFDEVRPVLCPYI